MGSQRNSGCRKGRQSTDKTGSSKFNRPSKSGADTSPAFASASVIADVFTDNDKCFMFFGENDFMAFGIHDSIPVFTSFVLYFLLAIFYKINEL